MEEYEFGEVELEEEEIGVCIECHSDQPEKYMINQVAKGWQGPGEYSVPCKLCGGVVKIVTRQQRENFLAVEDRRRGLYTPPKEQ